jgi:hypothetical protein
VLLSRVSGGQGSPDQVIVFLHGSEA